VPDDLGISTNLRDDDRHLRGHRLEQRDRCRLAHARQGEYIGHRQNVRHVVAHAKEADAVGETEAPGELREFPA
jgi:hypothetical protein